MPISHRHIDCGPLMKEYHDEKELVKPREEITSVTCPTIQGYKRVWLKKKKGRCYRLFQCVEACYLDALGEIDRMRKAFIKCNLAILRHLCPEVLQIEKYNAYIAKKIDFMSSVALNKTRFFRI